MRCNPQEAVPFQEESQLQKYCDQIFVMGPTGEVSFLSFPPAKHCECFSLRPVARVQNWSRMTVNIADEYARQKQEFLRIFHRLCSVQQSLYTIDLSMPVWQSSTNRLQFRLRSFLQASMAPKFSVRRALLVEPCASSCIPLASFLCAHHEGMWGVELQLHSFVTWHQLDVSGYLHISTVSLHREQLPTLTGGCVVPKADPDPWQKNVFSPTHQESNHVPLSFSFSLQRSLCTDYAFPAGA